MTKIDEKELKEFAEFSTGLMKQMAERFAKLIDCDIDELLTALILRRDNDARDDKPDFVMANGCLHCAANALMHHHVERFASERAHIHPASGTKH